MNARRYWFSFSIRMINSNYPFFHFYALIKIFSVFREGMPNFEIAAQQSIRPTGERFLFQPLSFVSDFHT